MYYTQVILCCLDACCTDEILGTVVRGFGDNCADKIILNVILALTMILCIFFCITDLGNCNVRIWVGS